MHQQISRNLKNFIKPIQFYGIKPLNGSKVTDLEAIDPGTYVIEEGNLKAIVSDAPAPVLEQVKWEAHQNFSDIQYIVRGKASMGVALGLRSSCYRSV